MEGMLFFVHERNTLYTTRSTAAMSASASRDARTIPAPAKNVQVSYSPVCFIPSTATKAVMNTGSKT